jgi:muramoyltetrapeptide carboxypeptidase
VPIPLVRPRAVRPGDRLAVVAPASPFARDEFDAGIAEVRRLGFEPVFDERVFARRGFVAGDPGLRARALRDALADPSIAGVLCVRGGYGSVQVLPLLDPSEIVGARKPIVGYSDITSLLVFVTGHAGLVAFHGPTVAGRLGRGERGYDRATFLAALCQAAPMGEVGAGSLGTLKRGEATGPLFGGTLTQLLASLATPFAFDPPAGHVLFIDEVNERPYRLDRMITQLRLSGLLERASGVVLGELPGCDEPGGVPTARSAVEEALAGFTGPVVMGLPSGHTAGAALTLPLGVRARVVADDRPRVVIEEAAVEP